MIQMGQHWKDLLPVDRYLVKSADILHEYDRKIVTLLYQPLIGAKAFSLYMTLWAELEQNRLWSEESSHYSLMALQQSNLKEIYHERLKLEGIGLLKTFVSKDEDSRFFIYELQAPLLPKKFFTDGVLNVYLYNRLGKNKFLKLKRFFSDTEIELDKYVPVTKMFNEVFESINPAEMVTKLSDEMEESLELQHGREYVSRSESNPLSIDEVLFDFGLFFAGISDVMIPQKAITPKVKEAIKKLSFLYNIGAIDMQNIVMSSLDSNDTVDIEKLRKAARDWYQFEHGRDLPALSEKVHPMTLRVMADRQPNNKEEELIRQLEMISPKQLLIDISGGATPSVSDLKIIEDVMFHQKLLPGVVNVLIYYVMLRTDMKITKGYVEKIAGHWARKDIKTVKEAMVLAKQEHRQYQTWAKSPSEKKKSKRQAIRTELLPDWLNQDKENPITQVPVDTLGFEEEKRKLEEKIKKYKKDKL